MVGAVLRAEWSFRNPSLSLAFCSLLRSCRALLVLRVADDDGGDDDDDDDDDVKCDSRVK